MLDTHEPTKKQQFLNGLSNFLTKYRTFFIILLVVIIVGLIAFAVAREVIDRRAEVSAVIVEDLQRDYQEWLTAVDDTNKESLEESCREQIREILDRYPRTYAAQRAFLILGGMEFELENWTEAEKSFKSLYDRFSDSYLGAVALWNLSVVYERSDAPEAALETLETLETEFRDTYPDMPHVLFSLGRMEETLGDIEGARERYNDLVDNFPRSNWTKLARDRIIFLDLQEE
jgi:predicted negative regulator of RcsB-dependent stress response